MDGPETFDDPGPLVPQPPGRARRAAVVGIIVLLIVSMVFLAFVSGRGLVTPPPGPDQPTPTLHVAAATSSPSASPAGRLAVVDAAGRLVVADDSGRRSAPLGGAGIVYSFPAWSPDGNRIAVTGDDNGTGVIHVFTVGRDGAADGGAAAVYDSSDNPPFYLYWSPDGTRLGFLTTERDGAIALRVAPADASAPAAIVRRGAPMYWAWTAPDGLLVHSGADSADAFVGEVRLDGVAVEPTVRGSGAFRAPAMSADRAFVGYAASAAGADPEVVVEARDGTGEKDVAVHGAAAIDFAPRAPDLAFIAPDAAGRDAALPVGPLRVLSASTGDVRVVLPGPVVAFLWSPDGRTIAALQIGQPTDDKVATIRAGTGASVRLAGTRLAAAAPGVALRLVFVDAASGATRGARAVQVGEVFAAQVLPYFDQYALSHRFWSPDSRSIALPLTDDDGSTRIAIIPSDGGDTTAAGDGVAAAWSP